MGFHRNFLNLAVAAVGMAAMASAVHAAGNAADGEGVFDRCAICHDRTKGGPNRIGPELFGVVGRKAGTYPGFSYSAAMQKAGFIWTTGRLDAYIASPQAVVPGNKMPFGGISNAGQRADLVAFLQSLK